MRPRLTCMTKKFDVDVEGVPFLAVYREPPVTGSQTEFHDIKANGEDAELISLAASLNHALMKKGLFRRVQMETFRLVKGGLSGPQGNPFGEAVGNAGREARA